MKSWKRSILVLLSVATLALGLTTAVTIATASPASATWCIGTSGDNPYDPYVNGAFIDGYAGCFTGGGATNFITYTCVQAYAYWNGVWNWVTVDGQCNGFGDTGDWGTAQTGRWLYRTATYTAHSGSGNWWNYGNPVCRQYGSYSPATC